MKVLVVSHSYIVEENRKNLVAMLADNTVKAVIPSWVHDRVLGRLYPEKSETVSIFKRIALPRVQFLLATLNMGMLKFKPDVIHIEYDPWTPIFWQSYLYKVMFAPKAKLVCTVKKNTFRKLPPLLQFLKNGVSNFFIKRVDHFIAVNEGVKSIYKSHFKVLEADITVLQHLGVDSSLFRPERDDAKQEDGTIVVGFCGRIDEHKGVEDLVEAVKVLIMSGTSCKLRLLGRGGLSDHFKTLGYEWLEVVEPVPHHEVADFMRSLDIFAMPARITPDHEEHDGHALMEAMACGVACLGTNSGVIPELLSQGAGRIVKEQDIEALSQELFKLASDKSFRESLALKAAQKVDHNYSIEAIATKRIEIYKGLFR